MRGMGTKRSKNGFVEIHGQFEGNHVNGKGYKKWKRIVSVPSNLNPSKTNKITEFYIYRGHLRDSKI